MRLSVSMCLIVFSEARGESFAAQTDATVMGDDQDFVRANR
jgi:hypothetical protein